MKKRVRAGEIPTASMADIAFLLLIFFLVTTTIDMDKGLGLVLPPKGEEKEIPKRNISNILINARGDILLDKEPIQMRDIRQVVREKMAANDKLIFSVKTHSKAKYQAYVSVLDQLKMANATRISIAETGK
ncbi:MAG: biopolymer transporter ExbD [Candidatus Marinimicrobia bacterium]|jgi:biopolymer transport protein ExbD|nr:biopolymer transporter ExbD [Candidatus Neomarinimicrobiota bacterium]MDP7059448.1 biopolymer transporter ExbD [Candidatus Neomarinimicrobiota bacterium]|tara:strand:+ start:4052 stop:4444 length:393 start_codon:yes stop_codon:yes gene_type:complete